VVLNNQVIEFGDMKPVAAGCQSTLRYAGTSDFLNKNKR
jgi:hypothetical protein